jgi:hypothetical protein
MKYLTGNIYENPLARRKSHRKKHPADETVSWHANRKVIQLRLTNIDELICVFGNLVSFGIVNKIT